MTTLAARGIVPAPIARQPWEMLIPLVLLTTFGGLVLYSAGGGAMQPFALSHFIRFGVLAVMTAIIAAMPREAVRMGSTMQSLALEKMAAAIMGFARRHRTGVQTG